MRRPVRGTLIKKSKNTGTENWGWTSEHYLLTNKSDIKYEHKYHVIKIN